MFVTCCDICLVYFGRGTLQKPEYCVMTTWTCLTDRLKQERRNHSHAAQELVHALSLRIAQKSGTDCCNACTVPCEILCQDWDCLRGPTKT